MSTLLERLDDAERRRRALQDEVADIRALAAGRSIRTRAHVRVGTLLASAAVPVPPSVRLPPRSSSLRA